MYGGDARMGQTRQYLTLCVKAGSHALVSQQHQFDRNLLFELSVHALGAMHLTHAAVTKHFTQPVGAEHGAQIEVMLDIVWRGRAQPLHGRTVDGRWRVAQPMHQAAQLVGQGAIHLRDVGNGLRALGFRQIQHLVQRGFDAGPIGARRRCHHGASGSAAAALSTSNWVLGSSSRLSQARALTQSRRTERSVSPSAVAVSSSE